MGGVTHGGTDDSFAQLSDALMAYDLQVISRKGKEVQESDLNFPKDWIGFLDQVHIDSYALMFHMIVVNDRISNPIMRRIGRHIIHFLHPRNKRKTSIGYTFQAKIKWFNAVRYPSTVRDPPHKSTNK